MIGDGRPRLLRRRGPIGLRAPSPRVLIAVALVVLVLVGGWLWLRDSSLVAVRRVRVAGASGPDAAQIRSALRTAARSMTTLDVRIGQLRVAVAPYPVVKRLDVQTQFPHGMTIGVVEQVPVGIVTAGGRRIAVSGDGTLLHDVIPRSALPAIPLRIAPGGTHLSGYALTEAQLLSAAPYELLPRVSGVADGPAHGLMVQLRDGPSIYFGDGNRLTGKWTAATAVLADPGSAGASYIDVTEPNRPAAGGGSDSATPGAPGAGGATTTGPVSPASG